MGKRTRTRGNQAFVLGALNHRGRGRQQSGAEIHELNRESAKTERIDPVKNCYAGQRFSSIRPWWVAEPFDRTAVM